MAIVFLLTSMSRLAISGAAFPTPFPSSCGGGACA